MNRRMLPPIQAAYQSRTVNGRIYTAAPGAVLDVPDFDAVMLSANGWIDVAPSGTTAQRPIGSLGQYNASAGFEYFDTTLSKINISDGQNWRDPATGGVV
jgi:hypothetical protein